MTWNIWPKGDDDAAKYGRLITLFALSVTVGYILYAKLFIWIVRSICGC